jgi:CRISPR type I-E-associated protein CasB/Cse2
MPPDLAPGLEPASLAEDAPATSRNLVGYLYELAGRTTSPDDRPGKGTARAHLAELRRSVSDLGRRYHALRIVGHQIPDEAKGWTLDAHLLTAGLFALYVAGGGRELPDRKLLPGHAAGWKGWRGKTLGASARAVNPRKPNADGEPEDEKKGITSRFQTLLVLPAEDLGEALRRFIALLRSEGAPIDFYALLRDLLAWRRLDQHTQKHWAEDYWRPEPSSPKPNP